MQVKKAAEGWYSAAQVRVKISNRESAARPMAEGNEGIKRKHKLRKVWALFRASAKADLSNLLPRSHCDYKKRPRQRKHCGGKRHKNASATTCTDDQLFALGVTGSDLISGIFVGGSIAPRTLVLFTGVLAARMEPLMEGLGLDRSGSSFGG